jgi:hypothetical protein
MYRNLYWLPKAQPRLFSRRGGYPAAENYLFLPILTRVKILIGGTKTTYHI